MSTPERDPRCDPRPGDRLRLGKSNVRVHPCKVTGQVFFALNGKPCSLDKRGWIDWCEAMDAEVISATAVVVRKGDEG